MSRDIKIRVDDSEIKKWVSEEPADVVRVINKSLRKSANKAVRVFRQNLNRNKFTGNIQRSVAYKFRNKISVDVRPEANYADSLEFGTRPHRIGIDEIEEWARKKGLEPAKVVKSIERFGTRKHPYLERTFREVNDYAMDDLDKSISKMVDEWNGGKES